MPAGDVAFVETIAANDKPILDNGGAARLSTGGPDTVPLGDTVAS